MANDAEAATLESLWRAVEQLLARASLPGILAHKLGPLAAARLRMAREEVPTRLALEERAASLAGLACLPLLERIRASYEGQLLVLKGPELALLYPRRARRFTDVDLLADEPFALRQALLADGFVEVEDPDFDITPQHHHLVPLKRPTDTLVVEVHKYPNWPQFASAPSNDEIFEASVESGLAVEGLRAPSPLHHALILTAHAWRHEPLRTLRDLIDVATLAARADERELERVAAAWGVGHIWRTTSRCIDALFYGGSPTLPLRSWARHLPAVRERTIFEKHLERLVHGFWGMPLHHAPAQTLRALRYMATPVEGETWKQKLGRTGRAISHPGQPTRGPKPDEH